MTACSHSTLFKPNQPHIIFDCCLRGRPSPRALIALRAEGKSDYQSERPASECINQFVQNEFHGDVFLFESFSNDDSEDASALRCIALGRALVAPAC